MTESVGMPWPLITTIVGSLISVLGTLIVLYLRNIKHYLCKFNTRIEKQEDKSTRLQVDFSGCKIDCERNFVPKEAFLRETGFQRRSLNELTAGMSRLEGKLTIVDKLPQICGDISREIVKEMKNGDSNGRP